MRRIIRITESELISKIKQAVGETGIILGRKYIINSDFTISIESNTGNFVKVKFTTKLGNIQVKVSKIEKIEKTENNEKVTYYKMTGPKGNSKDVTINQCKNIISFVDTGRPNIIKGESLLDPSLVLNKVE